jgi:hypothetical protein
VAKANTQTPAIIATLEAAHLALYTGAESEADNALADQLLDAIKDANRMLAALRSVECWLAEGGEDLSATRRYSLLYAVRKALGTEETIA